MIIDNHAHIFPELSGKSGYSSIEEHLAVCQRAMHEHLSQPPRRLSDNSIIRNKKLWDPDDPGPSGRKKVNFRAAKYGRFEWTQDGTGCFIQYLPPSLERNSCPPQMLLAMMNYAGIDYAVLQCGSVYGRLNDYYEAVIKEEPQARDRLIPLARIDEKKGYTDDALRSLTHAIRNQGLWGLWFAEAGEVSMPEYRPLWDTVRSLGIPLYLAFFPDPETWIDSVKSLEILNADYPEIPVVLPQAFPISTTDYDVQLQVPKFVRKIIEKGNILVELVYPIARGVIEEFPFTRSLDAVRILYESLGAEKLIWGSDIPMVERYCTYSQSLTYFTHYCDFIPTSDMELILAGNLQKVFGIAKQSLQGG